METLAVMYIIFGACLMLTHHLKKWGLINTKRLDKIKSSLIPTMNKSVKYYEFP